MNLDLKGKVAIITGASRGIGAVTARLFAEHGVNIVIDYYPNEFEPDARENAEKLRADIIKHGGASEIFECDVRDEAQVCQLFDYTKSTYQNIDILVNNAGIVYDRPISKQSIEEWRKTIDTNLIGSFLCSRKFCELSKGGAIINISSTNGINFMNPESIDYDATKAGIINMTVNFAKEYAPHIRVNSIAPGWVNTDMNKDLPSDFLDECLQDVFMKRIAEPEEIAKVALFLASNLASYITGETIKVDGGYT